MTGYVLGLMTFTFEENSNDEIYRCYSNSSYEIYWSETDLNTRIYNIQHGTMIDGVNHYDGIEVTLTTVETINSRPLDDIMT